MLLEGWHMEKEQEYIINNPQLMKEWDWEENRKRNLDPEKLTAGSGKKPSWICSQGHRWDTTINHRAKRGSGCPYCSNKKILKGFNDLQFLRPDLMEEWDFEENIIDPSTVALKSNKDAKWICPKGHKYERKIYLRADGKGCPICMKARGTSFPEQCLFFYTKKLFPDALNGYKDIFDNQMELDIYIPSIKTGIEYDGVFWHDEDSIPREKKKYQICKEHNIRLFRIKEGKFKGFNDVADKIWYIPKKCSDKMLSQYIMEFLKALWLRGPQLPIQIDVGKDKVEILKYKTLRLEDSLEYINPEVAKEWHPTKNGKLTPDLFTPGSGEIVWWLCPKCGREWKATIANRTKGHGCDNCATGSRKINKRRTILSKRGSLNVERCLKDWDYELNEHGPEYYTNGSGEAVHWKCHKCGYKWMTPICDRTRDYKNGCPSCSGKVIIKGVNDLQTMRPELMQDWSDKCNVDPTTVGCGSHLSVPWKCHKCGYEWDAQIYNRANGKGCPCCANRVVVQGINDLATTDPELAEEWHPTLNTLKPTEVTRGQSKQIFWICSKCGNVWKDTLNHRSGGRGCSQCRKNRRGK